MLKERRKATVTQNQNGNSGEKTTDSMTASTQDRKAPTTAIMASSAPSRPTVAGGVITLMDDAMLRWPNSDAISGGPTTRPVPRPFVRVLEGDDSRISTLHDGSTQVFVELPELLPIKRELRRIEISLNLDANGRLQATVEDHDSQRRETVIVNPLTTFEARNYTRHANAESFMPVLVAEQC
jgi:hypothetical protein